MLQLIERDVSVVKKWVKDDFQKDLAFLKVWMNGLEVHVQAQFEAASSLSADKFKK